MNEQQTTVWKHKALNGWRLFWLVAMSMSAIMVYEMLRTDLSAPRGVTHMIGFSVRFAVPLIYLVMAASAMQTLVPSQFTHWWLRNRKYIGLCFAVAMGWQGAFIAMMSNFHNEFYYDEIFFLRDELEGSTGYIFLTAMVLTSFQFGRRLLSAQQWKLLHTAGSYYLWAYPFSVYWWALSYYGNPQPIDYVFYWAGFLAVAFRIAAWGKRRRQKMAKAPEAGATPATYQLAGGIIVGAGTAWSVASLYWQDATTGFLTGTAWSANLELWLPFWPFEPFLSLIAMAIGTWLLTKPSQSVTDADLAARPAA